MGADGRWLARSCSTGQKLRFACLRSDGTAFVSKGAFRATRPPQRCGLPRTGRQNEAVRAAAGGRTVWLAL
jgi:hypothetical protein